MKSFIITIMSLPESVNLANRCKESFKDTRATEFSPPEFFSAITPSDNPEEIFKKEGLPTKSFQNNQYSRYENALSCFLSHYFLWKSCSAENDISTVYTIFEHDAVLTSKLKCYVLDTKSPRVISFGRPSYGKFNTPVFTGIGRLTSKRYFPGAHAYQINVEGARQLVKKAVQCASPTDLFLCTANFPWIQEAYPWTAEVRDSFSTVQKEKGCIAKHCYQKNPTDYKLLNP